MSPRGPKRRSPRREVMSEIEGILLQKSVAGFFGQ